MTLGARDDGERRERGSVASVERAAEILRLFLEGKQSIALTEIAADLDIPTSSAHRLLTALCRGRLLSRDTVSRRYELSPMMHQLGHAAVMSQRIAAASLVPLGRLYRATGEGCHVAVPDLPAAVFVERRDSPCTMDFLTQAGMRVPANCTSTGKVLLSFASRSTREQVLSTGLGRLTPDSIIDVEQLREELERIRSRGHAISKNEMAVGITSLATPIRDATARVVAAVGLAGRTEQIRRMSTDVLVDSLAATSRQIAERLNFCREITTAEAPLHR